MKQLVYLLALHLLMGLASVAAGYENGAPPAHSGNPPGMLNCTACHSSFPVNSGPGGTAINLLPANYTPSEMIHLQTIVGQQTTDADTWGFQLTALDSSGQAAGFFFLFEEDVTTVQLQESNTLAPDYLGHTAHGTLAGENFGLWDFRYMTPPYGTGPVTFHLASLAADGDQSEAGDYTYTLTRNVQPANGSGQSGAMLYPTTLTHNFELTPIGTSRSRTIRLYNIGNQTLTFSSITLSDSEVFQLVEEPVGSLAVRQFTEVTIAFEPQLETIYMDELTIVSNDVLRPVTTISFQG